MCDMRDRAFEQDRTMIEAQQRVLDSTTAPRIMPTSVDTGIIAFNRLVDRMVRTERDSLISMRSPS
jgi:Vanillate O-demethylase oxygenase C-terminal domain